MDWSKAKTYLILTFLLLDILLGYQFYSAKQQAQGYVQSFTAQLQELNDLLAQHRMVLETEVPKETPVMGFLQVKHPKQSYPSIVQSTMHDVSQIEDDKSKGTMKFRTREGEFSVTGDGYFIMRYVPQLRADLESSSKWSGEILQTIESSVWHADQYREDMASKDRTLVRFLQSWDQYPIFSATLEVHLQNSKIIGYNQKALEIGSQEEESGQRVLSAINAVRAITETSDRRGGVEEDAKVAIKDIQLGYYSPNYQDADVWYLAPMWRIVTDQKVYFVNAFTGQVEKGTP